MSELLKTKSIQHYSQFTDSCPIVVERVIRTIRNLSKKPVFLKGKADLISELPSAINQYNNTIHHSIKMTPIQASKKINRKGSLWTSKTREITKNQTFNLDT